MGEIVRMKRKIKSKKQTYIIHNMLLYNIQYIYCTHCISRNAENVRKIARDKHTQYILYYPVITFWSSFPVPIRLSGKQLNSSVQSELNYFCIVHSYTTQYAVCIKFPTIIIFSHKYIKNTKSVFIVCTMYIVHKSNLYGR